MSSNDKDAEKKKADDDIIKMLREAGVSTESLVDKNHAFWDTQVSGARFPCFFNTSIFTVLYAYFIFYRLSSTIIVLSCCN